MATRARQAVRGWGPYLTGTAPSQPVVYPPRYLRTARRGWRKVLARSGYFALSANFSQRLEEGVDTDRIELVARPRLQLFEGGIEAPGRPVRARLAHGDERIGGRDDARSERCRRPFEAVGIPTSVPALMVPTHDAEDRRVGDRGRQQRFAEQWMEPDRLGLGRGQRRLLAEQAPVDEDLADVVHERTEGDGRQLAGGDVEGARKPEGGLADRDAVSRDVALAAVELGEEAAEARLEPR